MIDKHFWEKIAEQWTTDDDGIIVPDDKGEEAKKAADIPPEDMVLFDDITNDEINDILAGLGFDNF